MRTTPSWSTSTSPASLQTPSISPSRKIVLTVHAERKPPVDDGAERVVNERLYGVFSRQLFLGDTLDSDQLSADYTAGVLTLKIPIAEKAKPRKVEITGGEDHKEISV